MPRGASMQVMSIRSLERSRPCVGSPLRALSCVVLAVLVFALAGARSTASAAVLRATQSDASVYQTGVDAAGTARYLDLLDDVRADAQRVAILWGVVARNCGTVSADARRDPENGCYDWSPVDRAVDGSGAPPADGVIAPPREIYVSVREVPCWLFNAAGCIPGAGNNHVGATAAELDRFRTELGAFLVAAATRYSGAPGAAPLIRNWTIWTEPNGPNFWSEAPSTGGAAPDAVPAREPAVRVRGCHFGHIYGSVAREVRADPALQHVRLGIGPLAPSIRRAPVEFLDAALAVGAAAPPDGCGSEGGPLVTPDLVDAVAVHPYPQDPHSPPDAPCQSWAPGAPPAARTASLQCVSQLRTWLDTAPSPAYAAVRGKPLWALETGYEDAAADPQNGVPAMNQALWYAQSLHALEDAAAEVVSWYPGVDGGSVADWQSGLVASDIHTRRPLALAFESPISIRASADGRWIIRATLPAGTAPGAALLVSARCDHTSVGWWTDARYAFAALGDDPSRGIEVTPSARDVQAVMRALPQRVAPAADAAVRADSFCVAVRRPGARSPSLGVVAGVRTGPAGPHTYLVTARVVEDAALDPRGDVLDSDDPASAAGPATVSALLQRYLLRRPVPAGLDLATILAAPTA